MVLDSTCRLYAASKKDLGHSRSPTLLVTVVTGTSVSLPEPWLSDHHKTPTVANTPHLTTKKGWTSSSAGMAIPNGTTSDNIDDDIDFSDLEAK